MLCGVEGASGSQSEGNSTTANTKSRLQLQALLRRRLQQVEEFGIHLVTRHGSCGQPNHTDAVIGHPRNKVAVYGDEAFRWTNVRFFQGERYSACPCAPDAKAARHQVVEELVVRKIGASKRHGRLIDALSNVQQGLNHAGDGGPQSSVREYLLRAVLDLNEGILPQGVDDYIAARNAAESVTTARSRHLAPSPPAHCE